MRTYTATTFPTQFVDANGIRFAYRRWGKRSGLTLVFNQHFTGNLDNLDPAVIDGLAKEREVIIFNNQAADARRERKPRCHCVYTEFALSRSEHAKCQADPPSRRQPRIVV
jgi:hypothetical protein